MLEDAAGGSVIRARRLVGAPAESVAAFLADTRNQIMLAESAVPGLHGDPASSSAIRAPFRVRSYVSVDGSARIVPPANGARPAGALVDVELGGRVEARVRWSVERLRDATGVELAVDLSGSEVLMPLLLRPGGRRALERGLCDLLGTLGELARVSAAVDAGRTERSVVEV